MTNIGICISLSDAQSQRGGRCIARITFKIPLGGYMRRDSAFWAYVALENLSHILLVRLSICMYASRNGMISVPRGIYRYRA